MKASNHLPFLLDHVTKRHVGDLDEPYSVALLHKIGTHLQWKYFPCYVVRIEYPFILFYR